MGTSKLLLPWPTTHNQHDMLIDHVLRAWSSSLVDRIVVVVRSDDQALLDAGRNWNVDLLAPAEPPLDMTSSIQAGLQHVATEYRPKSSDGCFVAPCDLPNLRSAVIDGLWQAALSDWPTSEASQKCVWTPKFGEQSGHPALLPWHACRGIFSLPQGAGVDSHVRSLVRKTVHFPSSLMNEDCDTPEAYAQALKRWTQQE
ncbi:MAG: hypothetical protein Aurels2KO_00670 [Aureliella sp.]